MADNTHSYHLPGAGESLWVLGDLYTFKVTGKQTNGAVTIIDQVIQPQGGPPLHLHQKEDESFYILDGSFLFTSGDSELVCETGAFVHIPRGTRHTFKNIADTPGRLLVTITPAGLEAFFYTIGSPAINTTEPPPFHPSQIDRVLQTAGAYGIEIIPPGQ